MEPEEALEHVTEVTVSASKKKQLEQYEPAEGHASVTANVPEDADPAALMEALRDVVWDEADSAITEQVEALVRKDD